MVRGVKNRFGAADEVGCFMLHDNGIECVADPSGLFLDQRPAPVSGTAVTVTLDGKRPLIGEVQALIATPTTSSPRRAVSGIDSARAAMIAAVLEKRAHLQVAQCDIYLSTVGGMRLTDPSSDLAVALAIASAYADLPASDHGHRHRRSRTGRRPAPGERHGAPARGGGPARVHVCGSSARSEIGADRLTGDSGRQHHRCHEGAARRSSVKAGRSEEGPWP